MSFERVTELACRQDYHNDGLSQTACRTKLPVAVTGTPTIRSEYNGFACQRLDFLTGIVSNGRVLAIYVM